MARHVAIQAPSSFERCAVGQISHRTEYTMELLTPMVGGGVRSWQPDQEQPIRSQAIKGQLRFWWRAALGMLDCAELHQREGELWGKTSVASRVKLAVDILEKPMTKTLNRNGNYMNYGNYPGYVLFPMQGQTGENKFELVTSCKFRLLVECPAANRAEVEQALTLWAMFGGLGARTRRGCGSLYCPEIMKNIRNGQDVAAALSQLAGGNAAAGKAPYPVLKNALFAWSDVTGERDAGSAWNTYLRAYGAFRQGPGVGRNQGQGNRPGRTRWPEADAIRRITGRPGPAGNHAPVHPAGNWFPRGAYGLPILTEFRNDANDPTGRYTLQPAGENKERWPSPMFLKVMRLGNNDLLRVCLILNHALPSGLELSGNNNLSHTLRPMEMPLAYEGKIMPSAAPLSSNTSPYKGIVDYFQMQGRVI